MIRESRFQRDLILEIEGRFPGCIVLKNDANYIQGFPDLTILYKNMWAVLECKRSIKESYRPNQEYYIDILDGMSFASMICPENREAVLNELEHTLSPRGTTCVSKRK